MAATVRGSGHKIVKALLQTDATDDLWDHGQYLEYCREELPWQDSQDHVVVVQEQVKLRGRKRQATRNTEDIIEVIGKIVKSRGRSREEILEELRKERFAASSTLAEINKSIDLAVRILLMLNTTEADLDLPQTAALQWRNHETLSGFVDRLFPQPANEFLLNVPYRIDHEFIAVNIVKFAKVKIRWTTSLEDHLRLRFEGGGRVLRVFPYKAWLIQQLRPAGSHYYGEPFIPREIVKEAIWTLDLLFPSCDDPTRKYLRQQRQTFHDVFFEESNPTELRRYRYWRERLFDLYNEFHAPPRSLWDALRDNRNPLQWYTFWFAALIAVLTIIQTILAGVALKRA